MNRAETVEQISEVSPNLESPASTTAELFPKKKDGERGPAYRHFDPLTSIRFFAAMYVLIYHWGVMWPEAFDNHNWYAGLFATGYVGVGLFFMLSGFILTYTYCKIENFNIPLQQFYTARIARVYPVYFLGWLLDSPRVMMYFLTNENAIIGIGKLLTTGLLSIFLLQSWHPRTATSWNPPSWSLSVEAFFYLIFPFAAWWIWRISQIRLLLACLALLWALSVGFPALGLVFEVDYTDRIWANFFSFHPLIRLPEFLFGIVLGKIFLDTTLKSGLPARSSSSTTGSQCAFTGLVSILTILFCNTLIPSMFLTPLLLPLFGLLVYGLALGVPILSDFLSVRPLVKLGEASFALYIIHEPFRHWFTKGCEWANLEARGTFQFVGLLAFTLVSSLITFRYLEEPARRWLRSL